MKNITKENMVNSLIDGINILKKANRHTTALHFVSNEEFFETLENRYFDISVPGVEYFSED